jgi:hypothetical protein
MKRRKSMTVAGSYTGARMIWIALNAFVRGNTTPFCLIVSEED